MNRGLDGFEECPPTSLISEPCRSIPRRRRAFKLIMKSNGRVTDEDGLNPSACEPILIGVAVGIGLQRLEGGCPNDQRGKGHAHPSMD